MNSRTVRATASRLTRRAAPTRTSLRSGAMYPNAAAVPEDLPLGTHINLPSSEPPPPGYTKVGGSDEGEDGAG